MRLYIKQSILTLGERFTVWNEFNEPAYSVEGSFMTIPKQFKIYDLSGVQVAEISRHLFQLLPKYDIKTKKHHVILEKHFTMFADKFSIKGLDWLIQGDFTSHHYSFYAQGHNIMTLRKKWFTIGDAYELDIDRKENEVLALALVIAIDYEILKANSRN